MPTTAFSTTTTSDSILQLTASGAIATGAFVLTCTDNIANNGAAAAVTFDIVSTKDTSALTGQTGYTITPAATQLTWASASTAPRQLHQQVQLLLHQEKQLYPLGYMLHQVKWAF